MIARGCEDIFRERKTRDIRRKAARKGEKKAEIDLGWEEEPTLKKDDCFSSSPGLKKRTAETEEKRAGEGN